MEVVSCGYFHREAVGLSSVLTVHLQYFDFADYRLASLCDQQGLLLRLGCFDQTALWPRPGKYDVVVGSYENASKLGQELRRAV